MAPAGSIGGFAQFNQQPAATVSTASVAPQHPQQHAPHAQGQFGMQNGGFGVGAPAQAQPQPQQGGWGAFGAVPPAGAPPAYPGTAGGIPLSQAQGLGYGVAGMPGGTPPQQQFGAKAQMGGFPAPQQQQGFGAWPAAQPQANVGNPFMVSRHSVFSSLEMFA